MSGHHKWPPPSKVKFYAIDPNVSGYPLAFDSRDERQQYLDTHSYAVEVDRNQVDPEWRAEVENGDYD